MHFNLFHDTCGEAQIWMNIKGTVYTGVLFDLVLLWFTLFCCFSPDNDIKLLSLKKLIKGRFHVEKK